MGIIDQLAVMSIAEMWMTTTLWLITAIFVTLMIATAICWKNGGSRSLFSCSMVGTGIMTAIYLFIYIIFVIGSYVKRDDDV